MDYVKNAVDVIIPTYKPDERFIRMIELLERQTSPVRFIRIVNTEKKYWDQLPSHDLICSRYKNILLEHISADEFDHGGTRRMAAAQSDAEYFVCMTQDALPADETLIEKLIAPLIEDGQIAVSYARQLPNVDASETERYIRKFNYPAESRIKSKADIDELGIKTYFCSNVCAAYRHSTYDQLGGFIKKAIFNEDMIYAGGIVKAGYRISYTASAKVYHSHNYSGMQQLHRNFDLAVSQAEHPSIFGGLKSESEGLKLVKKMAGHLKEVHKLYLFPGFVINCGCRYIGFRLGKKYKILPKKLVLKLTSNRAYWK